MQQFHVMLFQATECLLDITIPLEDVHDVRSKIGMMPVSLDLDTHLPIPCMFRNQIHCWLVDFADLPVSEGAQHAPMPKRRCRALSLPKGSALEVTNASLAMPPRAASQPLRHRATRPMLILRLRSVQTDRHSTPMLNEIPAEGDGFKLEYEDRQYNRMFPNAKNCPRPTKGTNKAARKAANQLNAVIKAIENGAQPACGFMCDVESDSISSLSCDECLRIAMPPHDVRKSKRQGQPPLPQRERTCGSLIPVVSRTSSAKLP